MLALVTFMKLVVLVYKTLTASGVEVLMPHVKTSEPVVLCLNTLVHVPIMLIADLVSKTSTKAVFGVIPQDLESAKNPIRLALSLSTVKHTAVLSAQLVKLATNLTAVAGAKILIPVSTSLPEFAPVLSFTPVQTAALTNTAILAKMLVAYGANPANVFLLELRTTTA